MDGAPQNGSNPKLGGPANLFFEMMLCIPGRERGKQSFEMRDDFFVAGPQFPVSINERRFFGKEVMEVLPTTFTQRGNEVSVGLYLTASGSSGARASVILSPLRRLTGWFADRRHVNPG